MPATPYPPGLTRCSPGVQEVPEPVLGLWKVPEAGLGVQEVPKMGLGVQEV